MANTAQAKKRNRQNIKKNLDNRQKLSCMRTLIKRVRVAIEKKEQNLANTELSLLSSTLDKLAKIGLIAKNKANRYKSRLCLKIKGLAVV